MKLSIRLGLLVACAALGIVILVVVALQTLRMSMLADRQEQISSTVNLAAKQVSAYVALEKSGRLSHEEALAQARLAMSGLRDGDNYVFVRTTDGLMLVHPDARMEGQVSMGAKVADGRTLMQVYLDALKSSDRALVEILTKRQNAQEDVPKINGLAKIPEWNWIIGYGLFIDDIDQIYARYAWRFGLIGVGIFALIIIGAIFVARRIYRTLGGEPDDAARVARAIAAGDLSQGIVHHGVDGSLMESIETMSATLRQIIAHIQQGADKVETVSTGLSGQMEQVNQAARQAADAAGSTAAAIEELAVSVDHISQSARDTETNASLAMQLAGSGQGLVDEANREIQAAARQVDEATGLIGGLVERSREIGGITMVIKEIADQTNLLALNAAIEAARAGEQGRGFAVVADEVRKLAERTGQATDQITAMVAGISQDTQRVVDGMHSVSPQVARGVDIVRQAGEALHRIQEAAVGAHDKVSDIAAATGEQSQASAAVARNVEQISGMLDESAQSVEAANENVLLLDHLAVDLKQSVERFRI